MFTRSTARLLSAQTRAFSTSPARQTKVAVLGAGGGIGQPLSLLLKIDPLVSSLSLYDIRGAPGVAADVSHIDSNSSVCCLAIAPCHRSQHRLAPTCKVKGYTADQLDEALDGAKVIVIPAGVPRKV
jgi:malate dehydrogenase